MSQRRNLINPDNVFMVTRDTERCLIFTSLTGHDRRVEYATVKLCDEAFIKLTRYIAKKFKGTLNG